MNDANALPTDFPEVYLPEAAEPLTLAEARAYLPILLWLASQPDATEETRQVVRRIRSAI